jgi:uncharacterized membrane protein YgdD (TMEM256/DUF423 family)
MTQVFLAIASILGGLAVAIGAFGAHALKEQLSDRALAIFETANRYQMYHALAILLVALLRQQTEAAQLYLTISGYSFLIGIMLFSGSLYALSISGVKVLGAIAPLGGLAFLIGWGCLAIAAFNFK